MFINRSFLSFFVVSLLMLASSDVNAQEAGNAPQPAGPISLTGLINGAAEPLSDSEAGGDASNGSEAIIYNARRAPEESEIAETDIAQPTSLITISDAPDNMSAKAPEATAQVLEELDSIAPTEDNVSVSAARAPQPANRIGLRSVSNIGLASIGLQQVDAPAQLNSFIWRQSETANIIPLILATPSYGSSQTLSILSRQIMVQPAVPPLNAQQDINALVSARLEWLAGAGQSDTLSALVRKLPDDEDWNDWKRWQVQYDLMRRADDTACNEASRRSAETLDGFWHKANIICLLLSGQNAPASFAADVLNASGDDDDNFFQLVDKLLGRRTEISLDMNDLSLVHLMLMDAAHETISLDALDNMPSSMIQALPSFRYLDADASVTVSYRLFERGLQSSNDTEQIWRSLKTAPVPAEAALSELSTVVLPAAGMRSSHGSSSPFLWVALVNRTELSADSLVRAALEAEASTGRLSLLLPLYNSLVMHRVKMGDAGILDSATAELYAFVMQAHDPAQELPAGLSDQAGVAEYLSQILNVASGDVWDADALEGLDLWHVLPLLDALDVQRPEEEWLARASDNVATSLTLGRPYLSLPADRMLALEEASRSGRVGETILLIAHLVQGAHLGYIRPEDGAIMMQALNMIGLEDAARNFGRELIIGQLERRYQAQEN
ncbi:hypothetical protein OAP51_03705 [Alphaproteobacteria bacterium]|nr:hypothetical protein [Alphaproteobacteria bacterium]